MPAYLMIARDMENAILDDEVREDSIAPSSNVLAGRYSVNIATAARALRVLQDREIVRRLWGIGMHVVAESRASLLAKRRESFVHDHIEPLANKVTPAGPVNRRRGSLVYRPSPHG